MSLFAFVIYVFRYKYCQTHVGPREMLYYDCRDIGTINEIETFVENAKPTERGIHTLLRQFPDFHDSSQRAATSMTNQFDGVPFPHSIVVIMGHAGSGKTHILKHMATRRRIMFYAPTNPAGINLQNTLAKDKLTTKNRKNVYRTIHSFYRIVPRESNIRRGMRDVGDERAESVRQLRAVSYHHVSSM